MAGGRRTRSVSAPSLQSFDADAPPPPAESNASAGEKPDSSPSVESPPPSLPPLEPESNRSLEERQLRWLRERERVARLRREASDSAPA